MLVEKTVKEEFGESRPRFRKCLAYQDFHFSPRYMFFLLEKMTGCSQPLIRGPQVLPAHTKSVPRNKQI